MTTLSPLLLLALLLPAALPPAPAAEIPPAQPGEPSSHPTDTPPTFPWSEAIPQEIITNALTPDLALNETPGNWRPVLRNLYTPHVQHCKSAREAVLTIASHLTETSGIEYSLERSAPCMSALETLQEKKATCTGLSIFLTCALRSVGIPARIVGIASWNHIPGNHTWVEAWFDGAWHMIEANEKDFNTPWVMEYIGMTDPKRPGQRIYAVNSEPTGQHFPLPWDPSAQINAIDVTDRYLTLARDYASQHGIPADSQRLLVDLQPRPERPLTIELIDDSGAIIDTATLPTTHDDIRQYARLILPRSGTYRLRLQGSKYTLPVTPTPNVAQVMRLGIKSPTP